MAGRTYLDQKTIREWLDVYIEQNGVTTLGTIVNWIEEKINEKVSRSTIRRLLEEKGIVFTKGEWEKQ